MAKFKLTEPTEAEVPAYGQTVSGKGSFELTDDHLIAKARANPDFTEVKERKKAAG